MKKWARVHFIPNLKDGEFVTLRAPYVLKNEILIASLLYCSKWQEIPLIIALFKYWAIENISPSRY